MCTLRSGHNTAKGPADPLNQGKQLPSPRTRGTQRRRRRRWRRLAAHRHGSHTRGRRRVRRRVRHRGGHGSVTGASRERHARPVPRSPLLRRRWTRVPYPQCIRVVDARHVRFNPAVTRPSLPPRTPGSSRCPWAPGAQQISADKSQISVSRACRRTDVQTGRQTNRGCRVSLDSPCLRQGKIDIKGVPKEDVGASES